MAATTPSGGRRGTEFTDASLRGARFRRVDLSDVVMRAVEIGGADIDAPWLLEDGNTLLVNGVDVVPYVRAQLDLRFPGRDQQSAGDPDGLRAAWAAVERAWAAALDRVAALPEGSVDVSIDGEWSFAETLRHLVMATDTWLRGAVLGIVGPYDPVGLPNVEYVEDGHDPSVFSAEAPSYAEVLAVRAGRQQMVRDFLATVTDEQLDEERRNPWATEHSETVRACLGTILQEEWEHLRYALRDLAAIERAAASGTRDAPHGR